MRQCQPEYLPAATVGQREQGLLSARQMGERWRGDELSLGLDVVQRRHRILHPGQEVRNAGARR